jgi:hypothetical protein
VDEARLIARYKQVSSVAQCAREFNIGKQRAKAILERNGIQIQGAPHTAVDEQAVLRGYERTRSIRAVSRLQGVPEDQVRAILGRHGVPHAPHGELPQFDNQARARRTAQQRLARESSPSDLLYPSEAARIARTSIAVLLAATSTGQLSNYGSEYFPRYRRDEILKLGEPVAGAGSDAWDDDVSLCRAPRLHPSASS